MDAGFGLGVFREGRVELVQDFPAVRRQRRRPGERQRPAVCGDAPQRQARSGPEHPRRRQHARGLFHPGRLACALEPHDQPRAAVRAGHRRQEHRPLRRDQPDRAAVPCRRPRQGPEQLRAAHRLQLVHAERQEQHPRRLRHLLRPHHAARSSRSSAGSTAAPCPSRYARATCSSSGSNGRSRRLRPTSPIRSPASSCRARAPRGSTSSTTRCRTRRRSSSTWASSTRWATSGACALDGIHALGTHFIIGRDVGVVFNPVVGGPDRVVNLESSVRTHYDALLASVERRLSQGLGVRASYTLLQGAQLRKRRPDSVQQRADRLQQPVPGVRPDAQRPAAPLHAGRVVGRAGRLQPLDDLDAGLGRADGHPAAVGRIAHSRAAAQRRRPPVQDRRRPQRLPARPELARRRWRRAVAACQPRRALQRSVRQPRSAHRAAVHARGAGEDRADRRDLQRLQRHQLPGLQQEELLGLRQRARARQRRPVDARAS